MPPAGRPRDAGAMNISDEEIRATRGRLRARGDELRDRVRRVRLDLARANYSLPKDSADAAIVIENDEILEAIEQAATSELQRIEEALHRIEAGTFAQCESCGRQIAAERLRALPHAIRCWDCERVS